MYERLWLWWVFAYHSRNMLFEFLFCKVKTPSTLQERASLMSSYYISFVNYLDELGSLLKSVHKFLGILARNKKYANFLITGRHGDGAFSLF